MGGRRRRRRSVSIGPSRRTCGSKPRLAAASVASARISLAQAAPGDPGRSAGRRSSSGSGGSSRRGRRPRLDRRSAAWRSEITRTVACRPRPVAKSRWITVSCRSAAMRSRSSTRVRSRTRACSRAFSMAMPAAPARATASPSSSSENSAAVLLLGEVQVAEHLVAHPDRHTEERPHRRVVGREPVAVGMARQVGQPQRRRARRSTAPSMPRPSGRCPMPPRCSSGTPTVMKSDRPPSCRQHPERPVPGVDDLDGGLDDVAQHVGQRQVRADPQHRIEELAESCRVVHLREGRHRRRHRTSTVSRSGPEGSDPDPRFAPWHCCRSGPATLAAP